MMRRLAIVAYYDPRGEAAPHLLAQLDQIGESYDDVILASPVELSQAAHASISKRATIVRRANYGHDFGSWRDVLEQNDWAHKYTELLLTNDSYVGFFRPLREIVAVMTSRPVEFWGITESARHASHLQSYFLHFSEPALRSQAFQRFWAESRPATDRTSAIMQQEIGISKVMTDAGYRFDSYFSPTRHERMLAGRRGARWLRKRQQVFPARFDNSLDPFFKIGQRRDPAQANNLNWSTAFADSTLDDGRLPLIKLDTLRYDPYWLGASSLLKKLEKRYPEQLRGVREYLDATQPYYSHRRYENYGSARLNMMERALFGYRTPVRPRRQETC